MALGVLKFGGSSVASIERIQAVANIIAQERSNFAQVVVVVSAMGDQTDQLKKMAQRLSRRPHVREMDMLLTAGERITMSLLSMALGELTLKSRSFTGSQSGILTDGVHGNARIETILGDRIRKTLDEGCIAIVAGFQGMNLQSKEITTLGRGGSDLTAVALAAVLGAQRCIIYTDVRGVCSADPRYVPGARVLDQLRWPELSALAWMGAGVMHNRAAQMAERLQIPVQIRSSFEEQQEGTLVEGFSEMEVAHVKAIAHERQVTLFTLRFGHAHRDALARVLNWFWQQGCHPLLAQQSIQTGESHQVRLLIHSEQVEEFLTWLDDVGQDDSRARVVTDTVAAVTIVGSGFWQNPEVVTKVFDSIACPIELMDLRHHSLTICVDESRLEKVLVKLHDALLADQEHKT